MQATRVACMLDHCSALKIDTEDMANLLIHHEGNRYSTLHLNYLERHYTWQTRVTGDQGSVLWDYPTGIVRLELPNGGGEEWKVPSHKERDPLFTDQLKHWLKVLGGKAKPSANLKRGIEVTQVAIASKLSAKQQKFISL